MAFRRWRIGLHIQPDHIAIIALQRERAGMALRRWWRIPCPGEQDDERALAQALRPWRRELPMQHQAWLAFPAGRTLQKTLPAPNIALRERDQAQWIESSMTRLLEMEPASLCFDYHPAAAPDGWCVTAARRQDIDRLRRLAAMLHLRVAAVTPDACALQNFLPWLREGERGLAWRGARQWLWATREGWGDCPLSEAPSFAQLAARLAGTGDILRCTAQRDAEPTFDPWRPIVRRMPPVPAESDDFAVALALAMAPGGD